MKILKSIFIAICFLFCLSYNNLTSAMFVENFDQLHDSYALNSQFQNNNLNIYFKKLFPMNGMKTNYILTAYDRNWQIPFSLQDKLIVTVDDKVFTLNAREYSRQMGNCWHEHTGYSIEFVFPNDLISAIYSAKKVTLSGAINPSFTLSKYDLKEWQRIIKQNHY